MHLSLIIVFFIKQNKTKQKAYFLKTVINGVFFYISGSFFFLNSGFWLYPYLLSIPV